MPCSSTCSLPFLVPSSLSLHSHLKSPSCPPGCSQASRTGLSTNLCSNRQCWTIKNLKTRYCTCNTKLLRATRMQSKLPQVPAYSMSWCGWSTAAAQTAGQVLMCMPGPSEIYLWEGLGKGASATLGQLSMKASSAIALKERHLAAMS